MQNFSSKMVFVLIIFIFSIKTYSNEKQIDSLLSLISKSPEKDQPNFYNELASKYWFQNPKESFSYSWKAYSIAKKLNNKRMEAASILTIGVTHIVLTQNDSAFYYLNQSLAIFKEINDTLQIANNFRAIADVYSNKNDLLNAQKYYVESYNLFELLIKNKKENPQVIRLFSIMLNNFAIFNLDTEDYKEAIKYFEMAKKYYQANNNLNGLAIANYNIGVCYYNLNSKNPEKERNLIDSSIEYYTKAYKIANEINNITIKSSALMGLGDIYILESNLDEGLKTLNMAEELFIQIDDMTGLVNTLIGKGKVYFRQNKVNESMKSFKKALEITYKSDNKIQRLECFEKIAGIYESQKNYKTANEYIWNLYLLKDSLNNMQSAQQIAENKQKFNLERKEKENDNLKLQNQLKDLENNRLVIIIISLSIVSILSFILIFFLRKRHNFKEELNSILKDKNSELELINATKDKFFSIIAHDLKNPIGSFKDVTNLMHDAHDHFSDEERKEFLELIKDSANNLYALLENLLEWSRSQSGDIKYNPTTVDLKKIAMLNADLLKLNLENKKIQLKNSISNDLNIEADPNLITTVVRNLLSNAIKFTPENGEIELGAIKNGVSTTFFVKDNGVGMDDKTKNKLFRIDETITSLGTNKEKGTGLGLILCKEFIEKHQGKIWVESELGKGSTFFFSIPK